MNLSGNWGRVNNGWSGSSMKGRLTSDRDDHLGSGHYVDRCRLHIVRYRSYSSCWRRLCIATFSLNNNKNYVQLISPATTIGGVD